MRAPVSVLGFLAISLSGCQVLKASSFQLSSTARGADNKKSGANVNFEDWISDAPHEIIDWKRLKVTGRIPSYVKGTLVRNGAALWSAGPDTLFSHIFDGLAKLSAYRVNEDGTVDYQNKFIQSNFYQKVKRMGELPTVISIGPILSKKNNMIPEAGWRRILQAVWHTPKFDNVCVNVWDYDPANSSELIISALTDLPARATVSSANLETLTSSALAPTFLQGVFGYEFAETAHPLYSLTSDDTYNVAVCLTLGGPQIVLVKESPTGMRQALGKVRSEGIPFFHSFGLTDRHAVVVLQPLRANTADLNPFLQKGYLRSMVHVNHTQVIVFDLQTGECVMDQAIDDKIYFYHSVSTATTQNEQGQEKVSLRLCAYKTPDLITGDDQFMRLERCQTSKEARDRIIRGGTFCDVSCNLDTKKVSVDWKPMELDQGFELPITRYSRAHGPGAAHIAKQHPKFVYAYGTFAFNSNDYDSWALFKLEPEKGRIAAAYRRRSVYVSEPIFVADPDGKTEDDGVILSQVYDGERRETALLVLNAKTMNIVAEAWTGNRSPMDFHGAWFPKA
jgi:carotenoid cleavage dioxygenase-like enzyme